MFGVDDALIGGLISGGASLLGGFFNNQNSKANAATAFGNNIQGMELQQQFNLQNASTAYQRSMADMKAAGLNPILAAGGNLSTSGATVGQPSSPMAQSTDMLGPAVSSALQGAKLGSELDVLKSSADRTKADASLTEQQSQNYIKQLVADLAVKKSQENSNNSAAQANIATAKRQNIEADQIGKYGPDGTARTIGTLVGGAAKGVGGEGGIPDTKGVYPLLDKVLKWISPPSK